MLASHVPVAKGTCGRGGNHAFWGALFGLASRVDGLQPGLACILSLLLEAEGYPEPPIGVFTFWSAKDLGGELEASRRQAGLQESGL